MQYGAEPRPRSASRPRARIWLERKHAPESLRRRSRSLPSMRRKPTSARRRLVGRRLRAAPTSRALGQRSRQQRRRRGIGEAEARPASPGSGSRGRWPRARGGADRLPGRLSPCRVLRAEFSQVAVRRRAVTLLGLGPLHLPHRKAPDVQGMLVELRSVAIVGELDLVLDLVGRSRLAADRAGRADAVAGPGAIWVAPGELARSESRRRTPSTKTGGRGTVPGRRRRRSDRPRWPMASGIEERPDPSSGLLLADVDVRGHVGLGRPLPSYDAELVRLQDLALDPGLPELRDRGVP